MYKCVNSDAEQKHSTLSTFLPLFPLLPIPPYSSPFSRNQVSPPRLPLTISLHKRVRSLMMAWGAAGPHTDVAATQQSYRCPFPSVEPVTHSGYARERRGRKAQGEGESQERGEGRREGRREGKGKERGLWDGVVITSWHMRVFSKNAATEGWYWKPSRAVSSRIATYWSLESDIVSPLPPRPVAPKGPLLLGLFSDPSLAAWVQARRQRCSPVVYGPRIASMVASPRRHPPTTNQKQPHSANFSDEQNLNRRRTSLCSPEMHRWIRPASLKQRADSGTDEDESGFSDQQPQSQA